MSHKSSIPSLPAVVSPDPEQPARTTQKSTTSSIPSLPALVSAEPSSRIRSNNPEVNITFPEVGLKSDKVTIRGPKQDVDVCYKHLQRLHEEMKVNNFSVDVPIYKENHKFIIGKGGANIKRIREETNTRIDLPDEGTESDVITIKGRKEDVMLAKEKILAIQEELDNVITQEIMIPAKLHNSIIGTNGRLIRSIIDDCGGVTIKFPTGGTGSDKVSIRGPKEDVHKAKKLLIELSNEKQLTGYSAEVTAKPEHHKFLIGKNGANIKKTKLAALEDPGQALELILSREENVKPKEDAINSVMPEESQTLPSEMEPELPMEVVEVNIPTASGDFESEAQKTSEVLPSMPVIVDSPLASRLLNFSVHYRENILPVKVPESQTVAAIKAALYAELGVPACRQELCGWKDIHITDDTLLSSLQLPETTELYLHAPDHVNMTSNSSQMSSYSERMDSEYRSHIIDTTNNKEYDLQFPGSKTVLETKLAALEDPGQALELILSREENVKPKKPVPDLTDSDNEFEDATECFGVDNVFQASSSKKIVPLMPENVEDETTAVSHFDAEFTNRYGTCLPTFQGTLADALNASCNKPAKERLPLAVYLHHDASVLTNTFCTQLLCSETIASYLALNFVTWAWDLTFESNKTFLLAVLSQNLGNIGMAAATTVRNLTLNSLPALMIITSISTPEVLTVIPGNVGLDGLMTRLIHTVDVFLSEMQSEMWEEEEARCQEFEEKQIQEKEMLKKEQKRQQEEAFKDTLLSSLQIPETTELYSHAPDHVNMTSNSSEMPSYSECMDSEYRSHIIDTTNNKEYDLQFPGSKTVLEDLVPVIEEMEVPYDLHRFIIGTNGKDVRGMMEQYDVNIIIPPQSDHSDIITIKGPPAKVEQTKAALREKIEQLELEKQERVTEYEYNPAMYDESCQLSMIPPIGKRISDYSCTVIAQNVNNLKGILKQFPETINRIIDMAEDNENKADIVKSLQALSQRCGFITHKYQRYLEFVRTAAEKNLEKLTKIAEHHRFIGTSLRDIIDAVKKSKEKLLHTTKELKQIKKEEYNEISNLVHSIMDKLMSHETETEALQKCIDDTLQSTDDILDSLL